MDDYAAWKTCFILSVLMVVSVSLVGCGEEAEIKLEKNKATIRRGETEGVLKDLESFTIRVRLFGAEARQTSAPFNLDDYKFIASPLEVTQQAFDKYLCERQAAKKASMIQVVFTNDTVRSKVDTLAGISKERVCVKMSGKSGQLDSLRHEGRNIGGYTNSSGSDINYDPERFVLLETIERIDCN